MAHRRGLGLRGCGLALALAALGGVGCSSGDGAGVIDGAVIDAAQADGAKINDTGADVADAGTITSDAGDAGDAGGLDGGGTPDGAVVADGGDAGGAADASDGDGDGGRATERGHAGASLVSAGSLMRSSRYEMISTLGGRSVQQTTLQSPNYRLRGGLVGTIGAR